MIKDQVYMSYDQYSDNVGVEVYSPLLGIKQRLGEHFGIDFNVRADAISAASIRQGNGKYKDQVIVDAVSGASGRLGFDDFRVAPTVSLQYENDSTAFSVGGYYSNEIDFDAASVFFNLTQSFNNANTTFSLGGSYANEVWTPTINRELDRNDKVSYDISASLTQLLTPERYFQIRFSYINQNGFLASPYHYLINDTFARYDNYPEKRQSYAAAFQWVEQFGEDFSAHGIYRFYSDSWEISSHTAEAKLYWEMFYNFTFGLRGRYYNQSKAGFTKKFYEYEKDDYYIVSDYRLSAFNSFTYGASIFYKPEFLEDSDGYISFTYDQYVTDDNNYIQNWYGKSSIEAQYFSIGFGYDF